MTGQPRGLDPRKPDWDDGEEGQVWRVSGRSAGMPWRCTLRWMDGGWTQIVGLELGEAVVDEPNFEFDASGRADAITRRGDPIPLGALPRDTVLVAVRDIFHAAADIEAERVIATACRTIQDADGRTDVTARMRALAPKLHAGERVSDNQADNHEMGLVVAIYEVFVDRGVPNPTEATAQVLSMGRATAARRIKKARDMGLLGPALQGKAGSGPHHEAAKRKERP